MKRRRIDLSTVHFEDLVTVLSEADDVGVLLRGHLWLEALLEYATRGHLERPDAIDWANARFDHKIALAEAVGGTGPEFAAALRGFNALRNRIAHEMHFTVDDNEVKTFIGRLKDDDRKHVQTLVDNQLRPLIEMRKAEAQGIEVEVDPALEWYPRVMTPARAHLFAFVVWTARDLAFNGAFEAWDSDGQDPRALLDFINQEVTRLTGGIYSFTAGK